MGCWEVVFYPGECVCVLLGRGVGDSLSKRDLGGASRPFLAAYFGTERTKQFQVEN